MSVRGATSARAPRGSTRTRRSPALVSNTDPAGAATATAPLDEEDVEGAGPAASVVPRDGSGETRWTATTATAVRADATRAPRTNAPRVARKVRAGSETLA